MSDPMTNVEIEDVLSSIRRLVSDDLRPATRAAQPARDKLVLTPADRVADDPKVNSTLRAEAEAAAFRAPVDAPAAQESHADAAEAPAFGPDSGPAAEGKIRQAAETSLEDTIAELEAAVAARADEFEPDGSEVIAAKAAPPDWPDVADEGEGPGEEMHSPDAGSGDAGNAPESAIQGLPAREKAATESLRLAEGLAADLAAALAAAPPEPEAPEMITPEPARAELFDEDDGAEVFDEEMLRDLVRDMIRQELQGALGERITRNVRKLVRSEIQRALSVRDME